MKNMFSKAYDFILNKKTPIVPIGVFYYLFCSSLGVAKLQIA